MSGYIININTPNYFRACTTCRMKLPILTEASNIVRQNEYIKPTVEVECEATLNSTHGMGENMTIYAVIGFVDARGHQSNRKVYGKVVECPGLKELSQQQNLINQESRGVSILGKLLKR